MVDGGPGLAIQEASGQWTWFYVDFCRAMAAAIIGDRDHAEMVSVSVSNSFDALLKGLVDVLVHGKTWTLKRDADLRVNFPAMYLFDGASFMTHRAANIKTMADLKGKTVCTSKGTTTQEVIVEISRAQKLELKIDLYETIQSAYSSFFSGECDAVADDATGLASNRMTAGSDPTEYSILPDRPRKEALSPVVRKGDEAWFDIIRWVVNATIAAEELGISAANVDAARSSVDPAVRRFLGLDAALGTGLGLDPGWAYRIVKTEGNYGEIYERNIGMGSPLKLERGLNRLWNRGGVLWSPPFE